MSTDDKALQRAVSMRRALSYGISLALPLIVLAGLVGLSCGEEAGRGVPDGERRTGKALSGAEEEGTKKRGKQAGKAPRGKKQGKASPAPAPLTPDQIAQLEKERELPESVFIENDENRDPFRSFLAVFTVQALPEEEFVPRPPVLLEDVSLDELRLIAIISGQGGNPRAMLVDPEGKGWVVRRGDYVGRGERVRIGPGQPEREINWRVVRVRPDRIILVREDPVQAGPPVTRVMRLYPEEEG
jgi:type IV pilus assembly protein PilP